MRPQSLSVGIPALAVVLLLVACSEEDTSSPPVVSDCPTESGTGCAPESVRVDLYEPSFSSPTSIANPLFPISELHSAVLLGYSDGEPFRSETTLLPNTKTIAWDGKQIQTLESQYVAFLDGRIEEVALDWYAQDDLGAVWYLGEDVFNYEDGALADLEGTWLAGRDGPPAMIMPADPQVGDAYRPENAPPIVFEEVTVAYIDVTVEGPSGTVEGAMVGEELHMDDTHEYKTFAPGYGEFSTGSGANLEAVALAVPADALSGTPPVELETLLTGATEVFDAALDEDWGSAGDLLDDMTIAWSTYQAGGVPPMLDEQMGEAMDALDEAVGAEDPAEAAQAAIGVARVVLDFHLRYQAPAVIDLRRFELWVCQILVDVDEDDPDAVRGDVTTLEWVRDRFAHTLDASAVGEIDTLLADLRAAADSGDLAGAETAADSLRVFLADL